MGDHIIIKKIEFLYGYLWQFDLYNETKDEHIRFFCRENELQEKLQEAKNRKITDIGGNKND